MGVEPGDQIEVQFLPQSQIAMKALKPKVTIDSFCGIFKDKVTRTISIEEMNETIADG